VNDGVNGQQALADPSDLKRCILCSRRRVANGQVLTVKVGPEMAAATNEAVDLFWSSTDCRAFPASAVADGNQPSIGRAS
jgi:hypothetical protein